MKKFIIILGIIFCFSSLSYAQPRKIVTPEYVWNSRDLTFWLRSEFIYQDEGEKDYWKTPVETVSDRGGDCEDFAILVSKVFNELMVENYIIVISSNKPPGHAITVFKEVDGTWSYFSNREYIKVNAKNITELLNKEYKNKWMFAQFVLPNKLVYGILFPNGHYHKGI